MTATGTSRAPLDDAAALGIRQVLGRDGVPTGAEPEPELTREQVLRMYELMVTVRAIDERGWQLQRSGRVEFWIPSRGQEASHVGSSVALRDDDWIFLADREPGAMLARGAPLVELFAQFFGRSDEPLRGRRLPMLLGNRKLNVVPCTTQVGSYLPHAVGAAWAAKLQGHDRRFIVYFGDGATSRGEFHSALNFAGIHKPPVVLFCQNNGWAVSTPTSVQTASATFAEKGDAYAVDNVRVDGNDVLAVHAVTCEALARAHEGATLIEAVTYRQGFHTSSDNPDLYRTQEDLAAWVAWDPLTRLTGYLRHRGWFDEEADAQLRERVKEEIGDAVRAAEALPLPEPGDQFDDLFEHETWLLTEQRERLLADFATPEMTR